MDTISGSTSSSSAIVKTGATRFNKMPKTAMILLKCASLGEAHSSGLFLHAGDQPAIHSGRIDRQKSNNTR
jgi:hypothetical protein